MRFYCSFFLLIVTCISCNYISVEKKQKSQSIDTIIDFNKVDVSPSFDNCKNLLDKAKTNCFRDEIQKRITVNLEAYQFTTENFIDEVVLIDVLINNKGKFKLLNISSTENIKSALPKLDSLLRNSIKKLPKISPAIKRGIPVNTQYQLPIRILTNE